MERLLFIDLLRIIGISLVILQHIPTSIYPWWTAKYYFQINLFGVYIAAYGTLGVTLFLFASGASLYLTHNPEESWRTFYKKRVLRIYPAYWVAILFAIMLAPNKLQQSFSILDVARLITGLQSLGATTFTDFYGKINPNFWFLSLILVLYIMFPLLYSSIKRHPHVSIVAFFAISVLCRYYFYGIGKPIFYRGQDWFPLSVLFEFGAGMYLIRVGKYLKIRSPSVISYLGAISFYIFLIISPLGALLQYPLVFLIAIIVVGSMFYTFDRKVHDIILTLSQHLRSAR